MKNKQKLIDLIASLTEKECKKLLAQLSEQLEYVGFEHDKTCLSRIPHSHSADCTCGTDELVDKFLKVLATPNKACTRRGGTAAR